MLFGTQFKRFQRFMSYLAQLSMEPQKSCPFSEASSPVSRNSNFGDLIGFEPKIITTTSYSTKLPNITNSVDSLHVNCDVVTDSISDGKFSNTLTIIPTDNLTRSYPFTFEPRRALFSPVSKTVISEMRITLTDSIGRPIDLNVIDWNMSLILRSSFI